MADRIRILIIDDDTGRAAGWRDSLRPLLEPDRFVISTLGPDEFRDELTPLQDRRRAARNGGEREWDRTAFDEADVLVIDYDLLRFDTNSTDTGETIAYAARCYSRCGLIIALNQYRPINGFDLQLRGHPESFADLNIAGEQLANPGLWREPFSGFRPWSWPLIPKALEDFRHRAQLLDGRLDQRILDFLDMPGQVVDRLPRSVAQFLSAVGKPEEATFMQFVQESSYGLREADKLRDESGMARVAASRLWKGLERLVLAGQDLVVDAPHLAERFPSLLARDSQELDCWNRTTSLSALDEELGIDHELIAPWRFRRAEWLSRPAWYWQRIAEMGEVPEVRNPWEAKSAPYVFCEDISSFCPREAAREFVADIPSPFVRRFVLNPDSKVAATMLAELQGDGEHARPRDVRSVTYHPEVRFAL